MSDDKKADIKQRILMAAHDTRKELRRVTIVTYSLVGVSLTAFLLLAILSYVNYLSQDTVETLLLLTLASSAAPLLFSLFNRRQSRAFKKLADYDDLRALGPLLNVRNHITDPKTADAICATLIRLLLRVKVSDRNQLNDDEYAHLLTSLNACHNAVMSSRFLRQEAYYLAVLTAMEQIGDERSLQLVEKIASVTPKTDSAKGIHSAALDCQSGLRARANSEGLGLLRPVVEQQEGNLLRPAASTAQNPDNLQLLRSGHVDESDEVQILRK